MCSNSGRPVFVLLCCPTKSWPTWAWRPGGVLQNLSRTMPLPMRCLNIPARNILLLKKSLTPEVSKFNYYLCGKTSHKAYFLHNNATVPLTLIKQVISVLARLFLTQMALVAPYCSSISLPKITFTYEKLSYRFGRFCYLIIPTKYCLQWIMRLHSFTKPEFPDTFCV